MMDLVDSHMLPALAGALLALLLDVTLKGALILAFAGLLTALLRRAAAGARHLVWCLAVCSVLALPLLTLTLPAWRVVPLPETPALHEAVALLLGPSTAPEPPASAAETALEEASLAPGAAPEVAPETPALGPSSVFQETVLGTFAGLVEAARAVHWTVWLLLAWLGGAVGVLLRFLMGAAGVGWLAYRARPLREAAWTKLAGEVARDLRLRRRVRLLRSRRTAMPMTWGLWRPVILLPVGAGEWSEARRRCVLTHEMAHVKRWDCLTQTLAQGACALYWFNPLVWLAARHMRQEREMACDDYVLQGRVRPSDYAAHLLDIARSTRSTLATPLSAVAMARPSQLEGRVVSILDDKRRRHAPRRAATAAGVLLTAVLVLPLAALRPAEPSAGSPAFRPVAGAPGEAYRWTGKVPPGSTVEIRGLRGLVQATPASGDLVEVLAVFAESPAARTLQVIEHEAGVTICLPSSQHPGACASEEELAEIPEIVFLAHVPDGVRFAGRAVEGDVRVVGLHGDVDAAAVHGNIFPEADGVVRAEAVHGDVAVRAAGYGQVATVHGDIYARLGRTDWTGTLPIRSVHGDVTVELPAEADTDIDLRVEAEGRLRAAIPLQRRAAPGGEGFQGTLGRGGRLLSLHTVDGGITVTYAGEEALRAPQQFEVRQRQAAPERRRPQYFADAGAPATEHPLGLALPNLDVEADLQRLRLQIGDLALALSTDLLDAAAQAVARLERDVQVEAQRLNALLKHVEEHEHYARQIRALGFEQAADEQLVAAHLSGVDPGYVRAVRQEGYCPSLDELVRMKQAGIDRTFLREVAAEGRARLAVEQLIALRKANAVPPGGPAPGAPSSYRSSRGPSVYEVPELQ